MKKLINIRVPLFLAVAFILGIYSCYEWHFGNFYFALVVALLLAALIVFSVIKRYGVRKIAIAMLIFAILGFGIAQLSLYRMEKREVYGDFVTITGRVSDLNRNTSVNGTYYLEDCTLENGQALVGRVEASVYSVELQTGDIVTVTGNLYSNYPIKSEVEAYLIRDKINYKLTNVNVLIVKSGGQKPDEKIRKYIYDVTHDYMLENGDVLYALLTGDSGAISGDIYYAFSRAGIVHLLAVSGLHVGFIVAIVCFALRRLRLHPILECGIVIVPLLFYAYVCAFASSVLRAIVMVVCSYVARACFGRYDMLSSISWAALLILFIQPFYLFDVGFQLSFLSVYGIATINATATRWLNRRKINKVVRYIINSLLISLSCVIATLFTVALNYGQVPVFSALLNIIVIPLVSVVFTLGIFGLFPSVFHYLLLAADYILRVVVTIADAVAHISFATVVIYAVAISTVIVVVGLFVFGGYVNFTKLGKRIFYPIFAILLVCSMIFAVIPRSARNEAYVSIYGDSVAVATVSASGEAAIVVDFNSNYTLQSAVGYLKKFNIASCTLYIANGLGATSEAINTLADLPLDKVYVLDVVENATIEVEFAKRNIGVVYQFPNSTMGDTIKVQSHFDAELTGVSVSVGEIDICIAYGSSSVVERLLDNGIMADLYVLPEANATYSERHLLTATPYQSNLSYNYGANKYGNFTIKQKGDKMYLSFR